MRNSATKKHKSSAKRFRFSSSPKRKRSLSKTLSITPKRIKTGSLSKKQANIYDVFNLVPGTEVDFLGLKWRFLLPDEHTPANIVFTPANLCDSKISQKYIAKAYKTCEFKIIIYCQKDEVLVRRPPRDKAMSIQDYTKVPTQKYYHQNLGGVIGIIFAKRYLDGIYISIVCASTYDNRVIVPTKLGLILQTTMLTFASRSLGLNHAYNHAANKKLVSYYRKLGWILANQSCETVEELSELFSTLKADEVEKFLDLDNIKTIKTKDGYPMKFCNFNALSLQEKTIADLESVKGNIAKLIEKYASLCLPKNLFSEYLKDYSNPLDYSYDPSFDIRNSFDV